MTTIRIAFSALAAFALLSACAEPEESGGSFVMVDPPSTMIPVDEGEPTDAPACEPADLCMMSIDDCGIEMTLDQCEGWYAEPTNCADMDGYVECNCECLTEAVCDDYFSCGEICFADLC